MVLGSMSFSYPGPRRGCWISRLWWCPGTEPAGFQPGVVGEVSLVLQVALCFVTLDAQVQNGRHFPDAGAQTRLEAQRTQWPSTPVPFASDPGSFLLPPSKQRMCPQTVLSHLASPETPPAPPTLGKAGEQPVTPETHTPAWSSWPPCVSLGCAVKRK